MYVGGGQFIVGAIDVILFWSNPTNAQLTARLYGEGMCESERPRTLRMRPPPFMSPSYVSEGIRLADRMTRIAHEAAQSCEAVGAHMHEATRNLQAVCFASVVGEPGSRT